MRIFLYTMLTAAGVLGFSLWIWAIQSPIARADSGPATAPTHVYGLIAAPGPNLPTPATLTAEYNAGVRRWLVELGWDILQATPNGPLTSATVAVYQTKIDAYLAAGGDTTNNQIILDLGLHHSPLWVIDLNPLQDQSGQTYPTLTAVPGHVNAVNVYWNPTVQAYAQDYITKVFDCGHGGLCFRQKLWTVRIGVAGGELIYPQSNTAPGATPTNHSFWAYDPAAQAQIPPTLTAIVGWKPGDADTSDHAKASAFYNWYVDHLNTTFISITTWVRNAAVESPPMYYAPLSPGRGEFLDDLAIIIQNELVSPFGHCCYGTGDNWQRLYKELPGPNAGVMNWCSSIGDASGTNDASTNIKDWSSAHIQAYYAQLSGRQIYGENPGKNAYDVNQATGCSNQHGSDTMVWDFNALRQFNYLGLMWVRETDFADPCNASLANYAYRISLLP